MMKLLLKKVQIVDSNSKHNQKTVDVRIVGDKIIQVSDNLELSEGEEEIKFDTKHYLSVGFSDSFATFCEPGFENNETIETGINAAIAGGISRVCLTPNTLPIIQSESEINFLQSKFSKSTVEYFPLGALTENLENNQMALLYEMHHAGAKAFSNANQSISNSSLLLKSLQYSKMFDGLVYSIPEDKMLAEGGMINEGEMAVQLGLKTRPAMAEEIQVYRDLCLLEYSNGRLHFPKISSQKSIELIRIAKEKGLKVTCGVSINNLFFNENALSSFDSNFKLKPPLRTISDQIALQNAVIDGTIDLICSDHTPVDDDGKETEFDLASFGAIGIQTMLSAAYEIFKEKMSLEDFVSIFNTRFNKVYNLEMQKIEEGHLANLCIFEFSEHTFSMKTNKSLSGNSLFFNEKFNFLPKIIIHNNKISYSDSTRN